METAFDLRVASVADTRTSSSSSSESAIARGMVHAEHWKGGIRRLKFETKSKVVPSQNAGYAERNDDDDDDASRCHVKQIK